MRLYQNDTSLVIEFLMVDSTDNKTGKTGLSPTVKLSKNGGAGVAPSGTVTEVDAVNLPGLYKLSPSAADVGVEGALVLHATGTGANAVDDEHEVTSLARLVDAFLARNQKGGSDGPASQSVAAALAGGLLSFTLVGNLMTVRNGDGTVAYTRTLTRAVLDAITAAS